MRDAYDVVVIGSGFGGAVVACRLAQHGHSVAVLERGRRWQGDDFPRSVGEMAGAFWEDGRAHGFLEYLAFRKVDILQGAGVGGGSLHYFNVNVRAPAEVFAGPAWPSSVTAPVLDPYYDVAQAMLESRALQPPVGRDALPDRTLVFLEAARRAGYDADLVPVAVFTDEPRVHPLNGEHQAPCTYCGNCLFGCQIRAKNTLDLNYLALAERRHGAEVFPLHQVDTIRRLPDGRYEVDYRRLDPDPAAPAVAGRVVGTRVVLAAGSLGSTRLLLVCRDRAATLPTLSPAVGTRFSVNGEVLLAMAKDSDRPVNPGLGPPITARTTVTVGRHIVTVEDLGVPDSLLWFLEGARPPWGERLRRLVVLAWSYLRRSLGLGARPTRFSLTLNALVAGGLTPRVMPFLGMGTDSSDGHFELRGDQVEVQWSPWRNRGLLRAIERVMRDLSHGAGGRFVTSLLWRWPLRKVLTAHPLGGCPMGESATTSAVNDRGEVWGHPNLFVVDGSIIPTALAVNPSLTIAALAERAAFWMVHGREMVPGDDATPANR